MAYQSIDSCVNKPDWLGNRETTAKDVLLYLLLLRLKVVVFEEREGKQLDT